MPSLDLSHREIDLLHELLFDHLVQKHRLWVAAGALPGGSASESFSQLRDEVRWKSSLSEKLFDAHSYE